MRTETTPQDQANARTVLAALGDVEMIRQSWAPDGTGISPDGIVGGDGAHESVSVRYLNPHLPNARITTYFYVVDARERDEASENEARPFYVEEMLDYYLADLPLTDETADEAWSDCDFISSSVGYATVEDAVAERNRRASVDTASDYTWDGERR